MPKQTFEMAMEKLQRIVDELETGNLPLEEARKKFEEGIKLTQFCSAKLTHEAVSANPYNVVICPHVIFAFEDKTRPGRIVVGYRRPVPGPSKLSKRVFAKVDDVLMAIIKEALGE